jgi:hypothetical protein
MSFGTSRILRPPAPGALRSVVRVARPMPAPGVEATMPIAFRLDRRGAYFPRTVRSAPKSFTSSGAGTTIDTVRPDASEITTSG